MRTLTLVIAATLVLSVAAVGSPITGSINELVNGDFETGNTNPWEIGGGLGFDQDGPGHNWGIFCKDPGQSLLLRQVVDESLNPLWNWVDHQKIIDLQADIRVADADPPPHDGTGVRFRLDWWDETYNGSNTQPTDPVSGTSDWVTYYFNQIPGYATNNWVIVNPFNRDGIIFKDFQPRWVSVEIELLQVGSDQVWVDNVILTSRCVPEPMSVMLGALGLGALGTFRRIKRK